MKTLTIVICLPGNSFSGKFLECIIELIAWCLQNGIRPIISRKESCNIYYVRNMCLGGDVMRGKDQKPFNGEIDYDYILWIDSDNLFSPLQLAKLIDDNKDIVSGIYLMSGGTHYATVKDWNEEFFKQNGCFKFLSREEVRDLILTSPQPSPHGEGVEKEKRKSSDSSNNPSQRGEGNRERSRTVGEALSGADFSENLPLKGRTKEGCNGLLPVAYTGMGFMLVKRGVFESLEYPWFKPIEKQIGNAVDFTMEDVAFCLRAQEKGYKIYIDPEVKVGHEKKVVL